MARRYPNCPTCGKDVKLSKVDRLTEGGYCYHACYKCDDIFAVTPA
jgi:hypothetical protein